MPQLRNGKTYNVVAPPQPQQPQLPQPPQHQLNIPVEIWDRIASENLRPQHIPNVQAEFPKPAPLSTELLGISRNSRIAALRVLNEELFWVRLIYFSCSPVAHLGARLEGHLHYAFADGPGGSSVPWVWIRNRSSEALGGNAANLSCATIEVRCICHGPKNYEIEECFRVDEIRTLAMSGFIQKLRRHFPDLQIATHREPNRPAALESSADMFHIMMDEIRGLTQANMRLTGSPLMVTPQQQITPQQHRQAFMTPLGVREIRNIFGCRLVRLDTMLAREGLPPYHVLYLMQDMFDTYFNELQVCLRPPSYQQNVAVFRELASLVGCCIAFTLSAFAQLLLARPNDRAHQRHYTIPNRAPGVIHLWRTDEYFWERLLISLEVVAYNNEQRITQALPDLRSLNVDYWCSVTQATADLRIAFARAAFVVGDNDEALIPTNGRSDRDPMPDIRENSCRALTKVYDTWERRLSAAERHLRMANQDFEYVKRIAPTTDARYRQNVQIWIARFRSVLDRVTSAVVLARENAVEDLARSIEAARQNFVWVGRNRKGRPKLKRPRPRKKHRKAHVNQVLKTPIFKAQERTHMSLLTNYDIPHYVGVPEFRLMDPY